MAAIKQIHFPDEIVTEKYKYRRMHISVYKAKNFDDLGNQMMKMARKTKDETSAICKEVGDITDDNGQEQDSKVTKISKSVIKNLARISELNGESIWSIIIPIPNELADSQDHEYTQDTGLIAMASDMSGVSAIVNGIGAKAANAVGKQKVLANPGYFQNYQGSGPRDFNFSFKFIPNSAEEAKTIITIINLFKRYSSPSETAGGLALSAPNFFNISFDNPVLNDLIKMTPCVITNIAVNYASTGILETTFDGMPKYMTMTMGFKEIKALTQESW